MVNCLHAVASDNTMIRTILLLMICLIGCSNIPSKEKTIMSVSHSCYKDISEEMCLRLQEVCGKYDIQKLEDLSQDLKEVLKQKGIREPGIVRADLDGDGQQDIALLARACSRYDNEPVLLIVTKIISDKEFSLFVKPLPEIWPRYFSNTINSIYIEKENPKIIRWTESIEKLPAGVPEQVKLQNPAIAIIYFEASASVVYWDGAKFQYMVVSD